MDSAIEGQQVMFTHTVKVDVFHNDHLVVFDRKEGAVQDLIDVAVVALGHEGEGLGHSLGSFEKSVPAWIFTESQQHLCDQRLQDSHIRSSPVLTDAFNLLPAPPRDSLLSHTVPLYTVMLNVK
jgi:hypothetical protein